MPDTATLIERLTAESHEFRKLHDDHKKYDDELTALNGRGFLSPADHWRMSELKKLKLIVKDQMEAMIRHARSSTDA